MGGYVPHQPEPLAEWTGGKGVGRVGMEAYKRRRGNNLDVCVRI